MSLTLDGTSVMCSEKIVLVGLFKEKLNCLVCISAVISIVYKEITCGEKIVNKICYSCLVVSCKQAKTLSHSLRITRDSEYGDLYCTEVGQLS